MKTCLEDYEILIYEGISHYQVQWWKLHGNDAFEVDIEGTKENGFATEWLGRTAAPLQAVEANKLGSCEEARGTEVLDSCNYSKGFVQIRLEYMNASHLFSKCRRPQLLRNSFYDRIVTLSDLKKRPFW